ncbi:MFS transporter [Brevibacillus dissolubilis]|uniref:MFS transporter n=1 Tax=Brevibacillus dissolubilis TaxID=1844116 RepID=UPI0011163429|nr:MFS transporter [Brevibacillus dissolubilis]
MQKKQLLLLFLIMFLMMLGFGIIIPILPFFVTKIGQADPFQLGLLSASYNIMQFLFSPIWGRLSDRVGRKPLILLALIGFAVTFAMFGLSDSYYEMLTWRILGGIVSAAGIPTVTAMVADIFPPNERAKGMGIIGAAVGMSFVFGPVIGGLLSKISLSYPFYASAFVALITFVYAITALPESLPPEKRLNNATERRGNPISALTGSLGLMYNVLLVVSLAFAGMETTFALYIFDQFGMNSEQLGYMFLVMGIIGAVVQAGMIGKLVKRYGEPAILAVGMLFYTIGFIAVLTSDNFWSFALTLSLFGAGQGMIRTTATAMITQRTQLGQGVTSGNMSAMDSLGRIVGPIIGGALYGFHYTMPFWFGALLVGLMLALFLSRRSYLPKPTGM